MATVHHLALRGRPDRSAAFHRSLLGLPERRLEVDASGLRAVWRRDPDGHRVGLSGFPFEAVG